MSEMEPIAEPRMLRIADLEVDLEEGQRILSAVRTGSVDALVVAGPDGERVYTLQGADESYRLLIERMSEGALLLSTEGDILYCNKRFAQLVGLPMEEVWGTPLARFVAEPERKAYGALLERAQSGESRGEIRLREPNGALRSTLLSLGYVELSGLRTFCAVVTDITERKQLEEALRQSERLAAIGEMIAGLSHESKNALQRLTAIHEMLQRRMTDQPQLLKLLLEARKAQDELQHVYQDVQAYASPIHLDLWEHDLATCLRETWDELMQAYEGIEAELAVEVDGTDPLCRVDGFRIRQVFRNLFENSLAACTPPVVLRARCREDRLGDEPAVCVSVCDNGPGVTPEHAARIFQPFFTTKTKGTGLGLAIVQRIVAAHGGTIDAVCDGNAGLEVVLRIPKGAAKA